MPYNTKKERKLNTKDMDYYNSSHGRLGHEVQESWPYLSNATPSPYAQGARLMVVQVCYYYKGASLVK